MNQNYRFPLFVDINKLRAVVVGAGSVAKRRAEMLAQFGADVIVVAPHMSAAIDSASWTQRNYEFGDLDGADLVVAATNSREVNRQVGNDAKAAGIPVNVADCPGECSFFFPAICLGDGIVAGIVGDGTDHKNVAAAARLIRSALENFHSEGDSQ